MRKKASPEEGVYLPLLQIHPWGSLIAFFLGWIHETLEPIWLSPPVDVLRYVVETEGEYGYFTVPERPVSPSGQELQRIVTRKGCPTDAFMIASDFVCGAFMQALDNPYDKIVSVPTRGGCDLKIWRLKHVLPGSTQEMYVAFECDVPQDLDLGSLVKSIIEQRDDAHDKVLRDRSGQMRSMVKATREQGSVS